MAGLDPAICLRFLSDCYRINDGLQLWVNRVVFLRVHATFGYPPQLTVRTDLADRQPCAQATRRRASTKSLENCFLRFWPHDGCDPVRAHHPCRTTTRSILILVFIETPTLIVITQNKNKKKRKRGNIGRDSVTIAAAPGSTATARASEAKRWGQLLFGIICMVMIANLQYGWTLFVNPIDQKYHWGRAAIQVAFTIFVLTETWLVPFEGYLIDKFGPRVMVCGSGFLVAIAWMINAYADSLALLYLAAAIGGFGAGSALTVVPIANIIASSGYEEAFWWFGIGQGVVVILVALLLRAPQPGEVVAPAAPSVQQTRRDYSPAEVLAPLVTSQFYKSPFLIMYLMFVMVGAGGLMAIAQLAPIANDYKIAGVPVSILGLTLPALTFALTIDRVLNGICRPF